MKKIIFLVILIIIGNYSFGQEVTKQSVLNQKYTKSQLDSILTHLRSLPQTRVQNRAVGVFKDSSPLIDTVSLNMGIINSDTRYIEEQLNNSGAIILSKEDTIVNLSPKIKIIKWEPSDKENYQRADAANIEMVSKNATDIPHIIRTSNVGIKVDSEKKEISEQKSSETKSSTQVSEESKAISSKRWSKE